MKVLVVDDDPVTAQMLATLLLRWGHSVTIATSGGEAWVALQAPELPSLVLLDWLMPDLSGLEICRRMRADRRFDAVYIIMVTSLAETERLVEGLAAGANDYVAKPFQTPELRARVNVGVRMVQLHSELRERIRQLEAVLAENHQLRGILPICAYCKRVRDDEHYWHSVEKYVSEHSGAQFSHGVCPQCYQKEVAPQLERLSGSGDPPTGEP